MAYQTGVSTTIGDLINAVHNFAVANGFTSGGAVASIGNYQVRRLTKNGIFFNIEYRESTAELRINTSTAVAGTSRIEQEAGAAKASCQIRPVTPPHVGYHLFGDGTVVHCVIELVVGVFQHMSFGFITKAGNWDGGAFVSGNRWGTETYQQVVGVNYLYPWDAVYHARTFDGKSNYGGSAGSGQVYQQAYQRPHVRAPYDGFTVAQMGDGNVRSQVLNDAQNAYIPCDSCAKCSAWAWGYELLQDSPNAWNTRAPLVPIEITIASTYNPDPETFLQVGVIPGACTVNMKNVNAKDMLNTDWMVFPLSQKNGDGITYVNSINNGMAYKK